MGIIEVWTRQTCPALNNTRLCWLFHYCCSMDLLHIFPCTAHETVTFYCSNQAVQSLLRFQCPKWYCSKWFRILKCERYIHQKNRCDIRNQNRTMYRTWFRKSKWLSIILWFWLRNICYPLRTRVKKLSQDFLYGGGENPWICQGSHQGPFSVLDEVEIDSLHSLLRSCRPFFTSSVFHTS